jgi:hypothetical protein
LTLFELSSRFIFAYMSLLLDGVEWLMRFCWEKNLLRLNCFTMTMTDTFGGSQ